MGKGDRDKWIVKCPKCGRIRESCRHISRDDVRNLVKLLGAGVEVYQSEEEPEPHERHALEREARHLAQVVKPRFKMQDLVLAPGTPARGRRWPPRRSRMSSSGPCTS